MPKKKTRPNISVTAGQKYRVRRAGKPPRYVRVVRVSKGTTPRGDQPKALVIGITRSGNPVRRAHRWDLLQWRVWLTWLDDSWQMPSSYERIEK
jgi:hypothetical protein